MLQSRRKRYVFVPVSVVEEHSDIGKYRDELGDAAKEVIMSGTIESVELIG